MIKYLLHRFGQTLIVVAGVTVIVFIILRIMPGDPVALIFSEVDDDAGDIVAQRAEYEALLGLDRPLPAQYVSFLGELARGDLGDSIVRRGQSVAGMIGRAMPITIELAIAAMVVALLVAVPVAVVSALRQNSLWDRGGTAFALIGVSMPSFWQGIMLIMIFGVWIPILPVSGVMPVGTQITRVTGMPFTDALLTGNWEVARTVARHLVLPAITLGTAVAAQFVRVLRSSLLEVKHQDFVDAFRARGIRERTIVGHMLHNALPTTVVIVGLRVGALLSGTIVIETVFAYPGMGLLLIQAIQARDFPVVQGVVVLMTVLVIAANLIADVVHGWMDPRIKLSTDKAKT